MKIKSPIIKITSGRSVCLLACTLLQTGFCADLIQVRLPGGTLNTTLNLGDNISVYGSISNLTGRPIHINDLWLQADTSPQPLTNISYKISKAVLAALGTNMTLPSNGYTGELFTVGLPLSPGTPPTAVCLFGVGSGTNQIMSASSPKAFINMPLLAAKPASGGGITLMWSNAYFRPAFFTNLLPGGFQFVTNPIVTNGQVYSITLPNSPIPAFFRLLSQ